MTDSFFQTINQKYSSISKTQLAQNIFKNTVNIGEAAVNILGSFGIAGFRFHIPTREQAKLENEVTDHYVDTNSAVQDHIACKPVQITLTGLQGDYFYSVNEIEDMLANVTPTLSLVKQFVPKLSAATIQAKQGWLNYQNTINTGGGIGENQNIDPSKTLTENTTLASKAGVLWNSLNGVDLFKLFQNLYKLKSAQTRAYLFFEALRKSRAVFSVECSWRSYQNMTVTQVTALRDENADITDITVALKQISFVQSLVRSYENTAGRTREQLAAVENKGVDKGKEVKTV